MADTPTSPPPVKRPEPVPAATPREARLAAALRANLRRRKASPQPARREEG